jgi:hypothetical protein
MSSISASASVFANLYLAANRNSQVQGQFAQVQEAEAEGETEFDEEAVGIDVASEPEVQDDHSETESLEADSGLGQNLDARA